MPNPKKTEQIHLRVTPEEKSIAVNNAIKSGDTLADFIKSKIGLEKTKDETKKNEPKEET